MKSIRVSGCVAWILHVQIVCQLGWHKLCTLQVSCQLHWLVLGTLIASTITMPDGLAHLLHLQYLCQLVGMVLAHAIFVPTCWHGSAYHVLARLSISLCGYWHRHWGVLQWGWAARSLALPRAITRASRLHVLRTADSSTSWLGHLSIYCVDTKMKQER